MLPALPAARSHFLQAGGGEDLTRPEQAVPDGSGGKAIYRQR